MRETDRKRQRDRERERGRNRENLDFTVGEMSVAHMEARVNHSIFLKIANGY